MRETPGRTPPPFAVAGDATAGETHVLFVCSRNRWRSPTAEQLFDGRDGLVCLSAGLAHDAETPLTIELVAWADRIFVMERVHRTKLLARFGSALRGRPIVCLDVPDRYRFMDPALVRLLERKVGAHLRVRVRPMPLDAGTTASTAPNRTDEPEVAR